MGPPPFGQIFNQPIVQSLVKQPEKSQSNVVENTGFPSNPIQEQPYSSYTQNVKQQYQPSQIAKVVEEGSGGAFNSPQVSDSQGIVFPDSYQEEELPIFPQPQPSIQSLSIEKTSESLPAREPLSNSVPNAASQPFVTCPSAMKCVPKINCDFNGVMVNTQIILTPNQEALRVPLIVSNLISIYYLHCSKYLVYLFPSLASTLQ